MLLSYQALPTAQSQAGSPRLHCPAPGLRGFADLVTKAPLCGRLIELLRDPLDDYQGAAGSEQFVACVKKGRDMAAAFPAAQLDDPGQMAPAGARGRTARLR